MKKLLTLILVTSMTTSLYTLAQNDWPVRFSPLPALFTKTEGKASPLRVSTLSVETTVTGNTAETTMTMVFVNDTHRILEGELIFPLGEGVTVSGYALDVNGTMRKGVVVPKAKARVAYENTIRRLIDPGLVEWTRGNNFRTRIYPILARGTKKVSISYEQTLADSAKGLRYQLPFGFKEKLDQFDFKMRILKPNGRQQFIIKNNAGIDLKLEEKKQWALTASQKNFLPGKSLDLEIPKGNIQKQTVFHSLDGTNYFYLVDTGITPQKSKPRTIPKRIKIIWDASNSASVRDHKKELALLKRYLSQPGIETIDLTILRNETTPSGTYTQQNIDQLYSIIQNLRYDGATRLSSIKLKETNHDAIILISDGIMTLGQQRPITGDIPIFAFHASQSAEHGLLTSLTKKTNGAYANLINLSIDKAFSQLTTDSFKLMSVTGKGIKQTFPNSPITVNGSTSISGVITTTEATTVHLHYGNQSEIIATHSFEIDPKTPTKTADNIPRIWAQKQLVELELEPEKNKEKITNLATAHNIVTRYTSLIVLDRIEDYVRYRITPPDEHMREKYNKLLKSLPDDALNKKNFLDDLATKWKKMIQWHNKKPADLHVIAKKRVERIFKIIQPLQKKITTLSALKKLTKEQKVALDKSKKLLKQLTLDKEKSKNTKLTKNNQLNLNLKIIASYPSFSSLSKEMKLIYGKASEFGFGWGTPSVDLRQAEAGGSSPFSSDNPSLFPVTPATPSAQSAEELIPLAASRKSNTQKTTKHQLKSKITLNKWDPNTPYIKELKTAKKNNKTAAQLEELYFKLKKKNLQSSAFYLDVAQFFLNIKETKIALRILSNIAEFDLENPALLRILAHRYDQLEHYDLATLVFREVLTLREEEPQSYRDLALTLEKWSTASNNESLLQESANLLWKASSKKWSNRLGNIQLITLTELNALIAKNPDKINTSQYDKRFIHNLDCDLRIVLTWDTDNTDIDLWVTDTLGDTCFYRRSLTETHGRMSDDLTEGYGPEVFMIKKAMPGKYNIQANYYFNTQQTLAGETTIQATIFTNFGRPNESRQAVTLRLTDIKKVVNIGKASFITK